MLKKYRAPLIVFFVGALGSFLLWRSFENFHIQEEVLQFEKGTVQIETQIWTRLHIYADILKAAQGLFKASQAVERDEWQTFAENWTLEEDYPGIQAFGVSKVVAPEDLDIYVEQVRSEGFPDYTVYPETVGDVYVPIIYIEPFEGKNLLAFGYNQMSESVRKTALETARDTGEVTLSGRVTLPQETGESLQKSFLMFLAIYENGAPTETVEERQAALVGYIFFSFRIEDLMNGIFANENEEIDFEVYDGPELDVENIVYASSPNTSNKLKESHVNTQNTLKIHGHEWTLSYISSPTFGLTLTEEYSAPLLLMMGVLVSFLCSLLVYNFNTSLLRAKKLAFKMTTILREQKNDLAEEEAKTDAILKSIGDGVIATDKTGRILFINKAAKKMLGLSLEDPTGKKMADITRMCEESGQVLPNSKRPIVQILKGRKEPVVSGNYCYLRKDNTHFNIALTTTPIFLQNKCIGAIEVFRDTTHEKEVDKAKTEFVSFTSHQLRTPLTAVKWYVETLLKGDAGNLTKDQKQYLDQIYESNERMIHLVEVLLNISRLELGTFVLEKKKLDPTSLVRSVLKEAKLQIRSKGIHVETHAKYTAKFTSDPNLLRMIFQNLITNAVKYTKDKGKVKITLEWQEKNHIFLFAVEDNGCGIPKEDQDQIFRKLFRSKNVRDKKISGTGLGLYIVLMAVKKLNGKVWFETEENKGTTFLVSLPG